MSQVVEIRPLPSGRAPDAVVRVPGSKSLTNRALVLAALAEGTSTLQGALRSEDTEACVNGLRAVDVEVSADPAAATIAVQGRGEGPPAARASVDVRLSGTTARFLAPYLALGRGEYRLDGTARMRQRPMAATWDALRAQGVRVEAGPGLPAVIHGAGGLAGGELRVAAGDTSQAASGLLMAAPFARADLLLRLDTHRSALPFVDMTAAIMAEFGVTCARPAPGVYLVRAGARYRGRPYAVEPDASAAAYFWTLAAVTGGRVYTPGIGRSRLQGDAAFLDILAEMGCEVAAADGGARVAGPPGGRLRAGSWDLSALGDQTLTLGVAALFADGPTTIRNVAHVRLQETDRLAALASELRRLGARCEERRDGLVVWPLPAGATEPVTVATHGDHRVAMSFALAGLRRPGVRIGDPEVVAKTFPDYFAVLEAACGSARAGEAGG